MSYNSFAYYYDKMMADVDYSWWLRQFKKYIKKGSRVLDVGCGTGALSFALMDAGYDVTGLDLSGDMLAVTNEKAQALGISIELIERDMKELDAFSGFDCILIALDSLNYLKNEADVQLTLQGAAAALNEGGVLIFDVHTPHKMEQTFKDYLYVENDEELTYIWHIEPGEHPLSVVHELTMFAQNVNGSYQRTVEYHHQRTYPIRFYEAWLAEAGFEVLKAQGDQRGNAYAPFNDRVLFVARKIGEENGSQ